MPDDDILQIAVQAARNYRETKSRKATSAETAKEFFAQLLPTISLALLNAYFYVRPAELYGETEDPQNPIAGGIRDSLSTTLTNFIFAIYACTVLFDELRKPYGKLNVFFIAALVGFLAATPTFFMSLMEVVNPSALDFVIAIGVTIGAFPGQVAGLLRFIKSIWIPFLNEIKARDNFLGRLFGNPEIARAQLELDNAFLGAMDNTIDCYIRNGDSNNYASLFEVSDYAFYEYMLSSVVQHNSQSIDTTVGLKESTGMAIGIAGSGISLIGASVPLAVTYFGICKLFPHSQALEAKLIAGAISGAVNFSSTMLAMIFGYKSPVRLYSNGVDVIAYLWRSIRERKLKRPQLPIEIEVAKVASFILIPIGEVITIWSYATMERLLQNTYGIKEDPANPNKIIIPAELFAALKIFVQIRALIFNGSGVGSVAVDAAMWLTRLLGSAEQKDRIITYQALQQIPRVWQEAALADRAQQLCKNFPVRGEKDILAEVTRLSEKKVNRLRTIIEDGKKLREIIDDVQDQLDKVKHQLAKRGCCFRFLFWKQDEHYSSLFKYKEKLEDDLEMAQKNYKNYTYETRHEIFSKNNSPDFGTPLLAGVNARARYVQ